MNIYQRIVLVIGGIAMAFVIYMALEATQTSRELLEANKTTVRFLKSMELLHVLYKNDCIIAIIRCAIVAVLTFSLYVAFKSRK